jgi:hypothetical protein
VDGITIKYSGKRHPNGRINIGAIQHFKYICIFMVEEDGFQVELFLQLKR